MIRLLPLQDSDREQFVRDNQEAFRCGAMEEFGLRDSRFEEPGEIISRATILKSIDDPHSQTYRIVADGVVAGGIVLILDEAGCEGVLDLLFVAPTMHSRGIGQAVWRKVEEMHPQVKRWITYTPYFEKRNIHFYVNRLGFKIVAYYHEKFPDPVHPSAADEMFKFEKVV
ncbi:MAG: GNAT family N-acetyltransferase [Kiritimatiellae bacterium]|nr:GNAT family N-acetyltransferase [Kiritimatiellia bacterium]